MSRSAPAILVGILLVAFCRVGLAAELHVSQDGTGDFTAIQDAIDAAQDGDTIVVHPGTYFENVHFSGRSIFLTSEAPHDAQCVESTTIDGSGNGSVVTFDGAEGVSCGLSGFTITNGLAEDGGGINCNRCSPAIADCIINGNSADNGGGIYLLYSDAEILRCRILGNTGGGIELGASSPTISECAISDNVLTAESHNGSGGGVMTTSHSAGIVENCTISHNTAGIGAGVSCEWWSETVISECLISENIGGGVYTCFASPLITKCLIENNTGSGFYTGGLGPESTMTDCQIRGNSAEEGGGLYITCGDVRNCEITGNSAIERGGGVYCWYFADVLSNCTISGNSARREGGGIYSGSYSSPVVSDCIVWANSPEGIFIQSGGSMSVEYSCVEGGFEGGGNIDSDPLFASGSDGDYYLSSVAAGQESSSPCIDAGNGSAFTRGLEGLTTRTDERPDAGVADMGYHYPTRLRTTCSLNEDAFAVGELLQASVAVANLGAEVTADVYVTIVAPDGSTFSLRTGGFAVGVWPWFCDLVLPSGFSAGPEVIFELSIPFGSVPGSYIYRVLLSTAGTGSVDVLSSGSCLFRVYAPPGSDYYVDSCSGNDTNQGSEVSPWRTITHAIASVESSEERPATIHVAAGTYSDSANGETFPLNMKSWVSLCGEDRETTVLDAEGGASHVIYCGEEHDSSIEGFTITGGCAQGDWDDDKGGGVLCEGGSLAILNNKIAGNKACFGGGIACDIDGSLEIEGNYIGSNSASGYGGGIAVSWGRSASIRNNEISGNRCWSDGAGVYVGSADSAIIAGNTIEGNSGGYGGGIHCCSDTIVEGNTVVSNQACWGGGLMVYGTYPQIRGNTLLENVASNMGGGMYIAASAATIENNVVSKNTARSHGGGIYCDYGSSVILGNTISDNRVEDGNGTGGGLCLCDKGSSPVQGNLITGNVAWTGGGVYMCCVSRVLELNQILDNWAVHGGAISCAIGTPTIRENEIRKNSACVAGGGIDCQDCTVMIEGNTVEQNWAGESGGGIRCETSGYKSPSIVGNWINENGSGDVGGGVCCLSSSVLIQDNTIRDNSAYTDGGGICYQGESFFSGMYDERFPLVLYNIVADNYARLCGGGLLVDDSTCTVECNIFDSNSSDYGGGIYFRESSEAVLKSNQISHNDADYGGGGVLCTSSSPVILGNLIWGNSSESGGGVECRSDSNPEIVNNVIWANFSETGGGIYLYWDCTPAVYNDTIVFNEATIGAGGVQSQTRDSLPLFDCIVWGNGDDLSNCVPTYCCVEDEDEGEANIHADPVFVTGPLGDFYLDPTSPCIDAGSRSAVDAGLSDRTTQTDGTPDSGTADMGFHYPIPD